MATTINAVASTGLVQTSDGSGIIQVQSNGVNTNAQAWVNYKGTSTQAILSSYNVSSVTYNGTGNYTINFTNAFADTNYVFVAGAVCASTTWNSGYLATPLSNDTKSTTQFQIHTGYSDNGGHAVVDLPSIGIAFFR